MISNNQAKQIASIIYGHEIDENDLYRIIFGTQYLINTPMNEQVERIGELKVFIDLLETYDCHQLFELCKGIRKGVNVKRFSHPEINAETMKKIIDNTNNNEM